jgi:hypothetical protein
LSLAIALSFFRFGDPHFFLTAFWPHQSSKSDFCYCSPPRRNDLYIDDLDDEFSSYMCNLFLKISYSARFFNDLIQIVWFSSSSRFSSLIFIKFISQIFRCSFLQFRIQMKNFLACQQMLAKLALKWWSYDWFWSSLRSFSIHHLLIFIKFTTFKSDFHQVHQSNFQMQLFEISHTDEKFSLYVNQFIRKRHSSLIVDIIDRSASIESDQIRSDQIKSNQIKSNQIRLSMSSSLNDTLRETITLRFVRRDFNQIIVIIAEISLCQMQRMRFNWTHFDELIALVLIIEHKSRKLNQFHKIELLKYLKQRSHAYLNEMCWFVWDEFEISVNNSTVNKALKRLSWNRKKMMRQTIQRNQQLRND